MSSPPSPASPPNPARSVPFKPRVIRRSAAQATPETGDLTSTLAQRPNESCKDFFKRRALTYKDLELSESEAFRTQRLVREKMAGWFRCPGQGVSTYEWIPGSRYGYGKRVLVPPEKVPEVWKRYGNTHRRYDAWTNEWDLNIEFDLELKYPEDEVQPRHHGSAFEIQTLPVETILHLRYGYHVSPPTSGHALSPPCLPAVFETYLSYIGAPRTTVPSAQIYNIIRTLETECTTKPQPDIQNDLYYHIHYPSTFLLNVRNTSFRFKKVVPESGRPWYRIRCIHSRPSNVEVLVGSSLDLLTILRHHSAHTMSDMVAFFVRSGMSWTTALAQLHPFRGPVSSPHPQGWSPSADAYTVYVQKRAELLRNPAVARAALMHGGLIWRLAKEHVNVRCLPPCAPRVVASCRVPGTSTHIHYDALTEDEAAVLCGVYHGGGESWFPTPAVWRDGGMDLGFWTADAERWFQAHVQRCVGGAETCRPQEYWRAVLRRCAEVKGVEIWRTMERLAGEFVDGYLEADCGVETQSVRKRHANFFCAFYALM